MRRSPRRPLILRRRKLPFFQNEPIASGTQDPPDAPASKEPSKPVACQYFTDGIRIMDHPSMCDTQVVVIPKTADLQSVIAALTAKGKECGPQGPNKFILLSEDSGSLSQTAAERKSGSRSAAGLPVRGGPIPPEAKLLTGIKPLSKDANCSLLDDSLTNIQWLGKMNTCALEPHPAAQMRNKENQIQTSETSQAYNMYTNAEIAHQPMLERPPYSYMAMIQFAINSRKNRKMTLKEIYMWIEDNFPYYREVAKPGWKNSIRHNLSLHDMFVREASPDGKIFFWTIRPEANRCLTLDQVYKPGCDSMTAPASGPVLLFPHQQQKKMTMEARKTPTSEKRMKPLLPRTESYLVPIQLPVASTVYLPTSVASFTPASSQQKQSTSRGAKRVRIAPKVTQSNFPAVASSPQRIKDLKVEVKQEPICVPIKCETPKAAPPKRQASSSRRKQRLVHSLHEEPVLLCPNNTFFDSGVASDGSAFQDVRDSELDEHQHTQNSPDQDFSFKTPIKSSSHLTSSTPTKPPLNVVVEPWKVTPVGKGTQTVLEVSPIRTPGGPAVTPRHDYTTFSFGSTPFKDLPLFSSPRELLTHAPTRASTPAESPPRHLPRWGAITPANRSLTEGLVLDTLNDSLSKILVDISFSGLDDEDLETANISWSEFLNQFK